jgi:hypothetical protein
MTRYFDLAEEVFSTDQIPLGCVKMPFANDTPILTNFAFFEGTGGDLPWVKLSVDKRLV